MEENTPLTQVDFHLGVQFNYQVITSLNAEKHKVNIDWFSWGVKITSHEPKNIQGLIIYATNIKHAFFKVKDESHDLTQVGPQGTLLRKKGKL